MAPPLPPGGTGAARLPAWLVDASKAEQLATNKPITVIVTLQGRVTIRLSHGSCGMVRQVTHPAREMACRVSTGPL
jgi:hypothetical protein